MKFNPREGLNTLLHRLQQHRRAVGRRQRPQGDRHGHRPPAASSTTSIPEGSEVATHFTPVRRSRSAARARPRGTSTPRPPSRCWPTPGSTASRPTSSSSARRSAATCPIRRTIATEIAGQLKTNLGINVEIELQESGAFLDAQRRRGRSTASSCSAGAPTIPDATNFLDYHFGSGSAPKFGDPFPDIVDALNTGGQTGRRGERASGLHRGQQPDQGARARRSSSRTAAPAPSSRPTSRARTARRSATRSSRS